MTQRRLPLQLPAAVLPQVEELEHLLQFHHLPPHTHKENKSNSFVAGEDGRQRLSKAYNDHTESSEGRRLRLCSVSIEVQNQTGASV